MLGLSDSSDSLSESLKGYINPDTSEHMCNMYSTRGLQSFNFIWGPELLQKDTFKNVSKNKKKTIQLVEIEMYLCKQMGLWKE